MKKAIIFAAAALIGTTLTAQSIIFQDSFDKASKWWIRKGKTGNYKIVDGGKEGKCINVTTGNGTFMANMGNHKIKNGAKVKVSFFAKGKGMISLHPMGRKDKQTVYMPGKFIKVTSEKWQEFSYEFPFVDPKKKVAVDTFSFRFNVEKNSNVSIDNFKVTVK